MEGPARGVLDLGQGELQAEPFVKADQGEAGPASDALPDRIDGINFSFPMGLPDAAGDRAIACVLAIKDAMVARLFDPQIGDLVSSGDHERIAQTWRQSHAFQFGVVGTPGLGGGPSLQSATKEGMPPRFKIMIFVAVVFLLLFFMFRSCFKRWMDEQMDPPDPAAMDEPSP
jgi:hypothetical protein